MVNGQRMKKQQGAALIVVMMILAMMISIAATMSERLFVNFKRAENRLDHQQAYWYSIGVEALAKYGIAESYSDGDTINLSQPWALEEQVYPLDYGDAKGSIRDMQSCFNINVFSALPQDTATDTKPYLVNLFQLILDELDVDSYQAEVIAESAWEFLDQDTVARSSLGAEDGSYESLSPPYLTANGVLADNTELRAIQQMDQKIMDAIGSIVCAIPSSDWRLNVNTVSEEGGVLLAALFSPALSVANAKALIDNRPFDGWATVNDFLLESDIATIDATIKDKAKGYLTVDSHYFELDAQVIVNESRVRIRSLLYSKDRKDVEVVRRRFGGISE